MIETKVKNTHLLKIGIIYPIVHRTVAILIPHRATSTLLAIMWALSAGMPFGGPVSPAWGFWSAIFCCTKYSLLQTKCYNIHIKIPLKSSLYFNYSKVRLRGTFWRQATKPKSRVFKIFASLFVHSNLYYSWTNLNVICSDLTKWVCNLLLFSFLFDTQNWKLFKRILKALHRYCNTSRIYCTTYEYNTRNKIST